MCRTEVTTVDRPVTPINRAAFDQTGPPTNLHQIPRNVSVPAVETTSISSSIGTTWLLRVSELPGYLVELFGATVQYRNSYVSPSSMVISGVLDAHATNEIEPVSSAIMPEHLTLVTFCLKYPYNLSPDRDDPPDS